MQVPVTLSESNVRKMVKGMPIQLSKAQLSGSDHHLVVHPLTHKKIMAAKAKGKGVRLHLTQQEVADSGEGFRDIWNKIKQGASWVKQNVIDTPLYQQAVKPIVRKGVDTVASALEARVPTAAPLIEAGVNKLSEVTGAFGLDGAVVKGRSKAKAKAPKGIPKPRATPGGSFLLG